MLFKELKQESIKWISEKCELNERTATRFYNEKLSAKGKVEEIFHEIKRGLQNHEYKLSKGVLTRV